MFPESGRKIPVIIRIVVVFPAPLRPSRPVIVPRRTVNETPSTARTFPNVFLTSRTAKISAIPILSTAPGIVRGEEEWGCGGSGTRRNRVVVLRRDTTEEILDLLDDPDDPVAGASDQIAIPSGRS